MNETLLILTAISSVASVVVSWKLGKEQLYGCIIIFLILISTVGGKFVEFWGFETNTGNVFYAAIFLATYFLIERYGIREGIRSVWIGVTSVTLFLLLVSMSLALVGSPITSELNEALSAVFGPSLRVAMASLFGFILSQTLNINLYSMLRERMMDKHLWLRANISNALAQMLDSAVFFIIAFGDGTLPINIGEVIMTSLVIKICFMMIASPTLYLNKIQFEEGTKYSTVTIR